MVETVLFSILTYAEDDLEDAILAAGVKPGMLSICFEQPSDTPFTLTHTQHELVGIFFRSNKSTLLWKQLQASLQVGFLGHAHGNTHTRARAHAHTHEHTRAHAHTHTSTHARTHARTHACTHAGTHTNTHAHTHARTHTRTHSSTRDDSVA
jgi:hypothetical protein